jgi:purine-nucleoside phosphorylase
MAEFFTIEHYDQAADFIRTRSSHAPAIGIVLGSGLSALADEVEEADCIPYSEIPNFPVPTIEGHKGQLAIGWLAGKQVMIMQGRAHYYEGYSMQRITLPIRVMQVIGVQTLILTNAAGGLNPGFVPGDLMLIVDHINLIGMAGLNPLRGPNLDRFGPRFPNMSQAYDPDLMALALRVASRLEFPLHQGVYVCLAGPSFETPADCRFLRIIGADAVGMSTVPEVIVARHGGMRVMGVSGISNTMAETAAPASHEEVLQAGRVITPRLLALLKGVLHEMG